MVPAKTARALARASAPTPRVRRDVLYGIVVAALSLALTVVLAAHLSGGRASGDAAIYARMAARPWVFTQSPWGYRLLTPWLVHRLPLPLPVGFWLLTVLALAGTATVLALLCRSAGLSRRAGGLAAVLFVLSDAATFDLSDWGLVDPLAYLGTALCLLMLARGRFVAAALCVLGTTLDKEWGCFLVVPLCAALWLNRTRGGLPRPAALHLAAALLLGVAAPALCYWLVRHWPGFGGGSYAGYYRGGLLSAAQHELRHADLRGAVGVAWGGLWAPALVALRRAGPLRLGALLLPGVAVQLALASDSARMLDYASIALIPLAAAALDALPAPAWCAAALLAAYSVAGSLPPALLLRVPQGPWLTLTPQQRGLPALLLAFGLAVLAMRAAAHQRVRLTSEPAGSAA